MKFEIDIGKVVDNIVSEALEREIDGKTIKQWMVEIAKHQWISVKDGLPENDNEVITAYKIDDEKVMKKRKGKLFVQTGSWMGDRWTSVWDEYKAFGIEEEVLYWMPLPEPPKEKQ